MATVAVEAVIRDIDDETLEMLVDWADNQNYYTVEVGLRHDGDKQDFVLTPHFPEIDWVRWGNLITALGRYAETL